MIRAVNRDDRSLGEIAGQQCVSHSSAVFHLKPSYCQHTYETTCERHKSLLMFHDAVIIPEVTIGHCMLFNRWSHCDEMAAVRTDFITHEQHSVTHYSLSFTLTPDLCHSKSVYGVQSAEIFTLILQTRGAPQNPFPSR